MAYKVEEEKPNWICDCSQFLTVKGRIHLLPFPYEQWATGGKLGSCHEEKSSLEIKTSLVSAVPQFAVVADPFVTLTQVTDPENRHHHHSPTCSATGHLGVPQVSWPPCIFTAIALASVTPVHCHPSYTCASSALSLLVLHACFLPRTGSNPLSALASSPDICQACIHHTTLHRSQDDLALHRGLFPTLALHVRMFFLLSFALPIQTHTCALFPAALFSWAWPLTSAWSCVSPYVEIACLLTFI